MPLIYIFGVTVLERFRGNFKNTNILEERTVS